jgi:hypothetical protein
MNKMNTASDHFRAATVVALYLVRFIQLGSVIIAGYAVCYLVFIHNHHYCAIRYCGDYGREAAAVPIGEVMFIISVMTLALM